MFFIEIGSKTETTILQTITDNDSDYGSTRLDSKKSVRRNVTYIQAVSMIVTYMIGSGVYISPSLVATRSKNMFNAIIVWILAGGCALLGSLCYNELASFVKKTGSSYLFVLEWKLSCFFTSIEKRSYRDIVWYQYNSLYSWDVHM